MNGYKVCNLGELKNFFFSLMLIKYIHKINKGMERLAMVY